jgi:YidC/Oxa1 family membrane protein insertase
LFSGLVDFISQIIQFFYNLTASFGLANYGLAIVLFTIAIKIVFLPLTYKQVNGMRAMQELQPKVQQIQKKHKNNPQKAQQEVMSLYKENNANPFAGCWPILIQMPILFALFSALRTFFDPVNHPEYVNLLDAKFFWISNLGQPDPIILPVLVALGTFFQQKVTSPGNTEGPQKTFIYIMPLFIGFISRNFPAGLALYWVMYSIMGILEQYIIRRPMVKEEVSTK